MAAKKRTLEIIALDMDTDGNVCRCEYVCGCITSLANGTWMYIKRCNQHPQPRLKVMITPVARTDIWDAFIP